MTATCIEPLALYRPRDPQASDLWRLIDEHFATFQQVYDDRYQAKYGFWRPRPPSTSCTPLPSQFFGTRLGACGTQFSYHLSLRGKQELRGR